MEAEAKIEVSWHQVEAIRARIALILKHDRCFDASPLRVAAAQVCFDLYRIHHLRVDRPTADYAAALFAMVEHKGHLLFGSRPGCAYCQGLIRFNERDAAALRATYESADRAVETVAHE